MSKSRDFSAVEALSQFQDLHQKMKIVTIAKMKEEAVQNLTLDDFTIIEAGILEDSSFLQVDFLADALKYLKDPDLFTQTTQWIMIDLLESFLKNHEIYKSTFSSALENNDFEDQQNKKAILDLIKLYYEKSNRPMPERAKLPKLDHINRKYPGKIAEPPPGVVFKHLKVNENGDIVHSRPHKDGRTTFERVKAFQDKKSKPKRPSPLGKQEDSKASLEEDLDTITKTLSSQSLEQNTQELAEINLIGGRCIDYFVDQDLIGVFIENNCFPNFENCNSHELKASLEKNPLYQDGEKINEIMKFVETYKDVQARKKILEPILEEQSRMTQTISNTSSQNSSHTSSSPQRSKRF